ncbi:uncharacterized protein LOC144708833 [Wolffia australiana]
MDSTGSEPPCPQELSAEAIPLFIEGVSLVLSRWTALQLAVEDGWGGKDSRQKSKDLESDVISWFIQTNEPLYIDDLEAILDENMVRSFNAEIDDGSIMEVAEKLMILHEECLEGNYASLEKLRMTKPSVQAISQSQMMMNEDEEDESDMMMTDALNSEPVAAVERIPKQVIDEDGWSVVPPRKNKDKKTG